MDSYLVVCPVCGQKREWGKPGGIGVHEPPPYCQKGHEPVRMEREEPE